ncbi:MULTISPECIES: NepR family anti-sigma factor [Sphingobium]|uniref:NepR family anti-sigma factor n=1 Tax=Sphingobium TaxID=165695 RepID=UPI0018D2152D|nr:MULTISPECIES: NepR family anti-sigma factor [Sphingobium]
MKRAQPSARGKRGSRSKNKEHVADALRSVYQRAIDEDIPAEMLDLLSKLD